VFDGAGNVTEVEEDGSPTGITGSVQHVSGQYYEGQLTNFTEMRLFLDPTQGYIAYWDESDIAALERGATTLPVGGFQVADIAPGFYTGRFFAIDAQVRVTQARDGFADILADGSYSGSDEDGFDFGSPTGTMLAPSGNVLAGPYKDSVNPTTGFADFLPSPDGQFLVVAAFPLLNTMIQNAEFIGAWNRE